MYMRQQERRKKPTLPDGLTHVKPVLYYKSLNFVNPIDLFRKGDLKA